MVIVRFMAIKGLDTESKDNFIYSLNGDIYADFYIENNQTFIRDGEKKKRLYPYSFVELKLDSKKVVYQLLPDKKEHTLSLFTRSKWFEVIGGDYKSRDGDSLVRLKAGDEPSLLILNSNKKRSLYGAKQLKVVALKSGYYYQSLDNRKIPIPVYNGSLRNIRNSVTWNRLEGVDIGLGYITNGKDIIKIYLGTKNRSVLVSKKPKKYNLVKGKTINISIVDKKTPSSTLELVYADRGLYRKRLSYNFIRIAHLLVTYGIDNAKTTITKNINPQNFLKDELLELIDDNIRESHFYQKYLKKRGSLGIGESKKLNDKLLRYVNDGDYYRTKIALRMGADVNVLDTENRDLLTVVLSKQKKYLEIPKELTFEDNRLILRGNKKVFNNSTYAKGGYFPINAPILDKPKIPKKSNLNVEKLNEFVDVMHMNGLYVSDKSARVFYSKTANNFIQEAEIDYRKAPPLFLYNSEIEGKFVAPVSKIKGKFYYKIKTKKTKIKVAFNGKIKHNGKVLSRNFNEILPFYDTHTVNVRGGEAILEVYLEDRILPCGVIFSSSKKLKNFQYSYNGRYYKRFKIINRGDRYDYQLQRDSSKAFKSYYLKVKADAVGDVKYLGNGKRYRIGRKAKTIGYSPALSCLSRESESRFLSLYDSDNIMEIVPKSYSEYGMIPKNRAKAIAGEVEDNTTADILSKKLLPIYGDGIHLGLTSKGLKADELTLDASFSKEVADIFEEVIKPLKSKANRKKREKYNSMLEGAVVVLADKGKDNLQVVSMFSYPYPKDLDVNKKEHYKKEIFKYMLMDEFNNPTSSLRNRALDMRIRPGSTFKTVTAIAGFKEKIINRLDTQYRQYIEGKPDVDGSPFRNGTTLDLRLKNFSFSNGFTERTDNATFQNSFKMSYNVYFGYLALLLNHKLDNGFRKTLYPISNELKDREQEFPLLKVADELGFNKPIFLSKEKKIFASPSVFPNSFILSKEVADSAIGQFEVAATPMQMAIVANTIRSRDVEIPKIVKAEKSQTIHKNYIDVPTQRAIGEAMGMVVSDKDGTAKCAFYSNTFMEQARAYNRRVEPNRRIGVPCYGYSSKFKKVNPKDFAFSDVKVYGKTGTAEKGKGGLYDGWFISFTKSKKRGDIVVATVVRNSGTGGTYSATITKRVIEAWYQKLNKKGKK